ncbi:AAA family ATPase [Peterkaempfera sp. SMS 1(5)a]|uniref:AAA family ATPase n=1 Tax=Peterkaempfera podocarpi TaxID=3232308 RepID=UPI00366CECED
MENVRHIPHPSPDTDDDGRDTEAAIKRMVPSDVASERAVLKECMHQGATAYASAAQVLQGRADFYHPANQVIWDQLGHQVRNQQPTDPIALRAELEKTGLLRQAGGAPYLFEIASTHTGGTASYYAGFVREKAELREQSDLAFRITTELGRGASPEDIEHLIEDHHQAARMRATASTGAGPAALMGSLLDWDQLFETDFGSVELLPGRLMAPGQQIALVGDGKAGKSLFSLEWAWRMATGRRFLDSPPQAPVPVLYVDAENGHEQIQSRLISFGATPETMGLLRYASFPPMRPLDTPQGGADLIALARAVGAQVVFIDTISRFISGEENSADPWLSLYRSTLMPLKAAGIASIRLDHFGKDATRGARGNSAKTQDVDHVWELSAQGGGIVTLKRTHTRTGVGEDGFTILRQARKRGDHWEAGGTRHVLVTHEHRAELIPGSPEHIAAQLDRAGVPATYGRERLRAECATRGIAVRTELLADVARLRKQRAAAPDQDRGQVGDRSDLGFSQAHPLPLDHHDPQTNPEPGQNRAEQGAKPVPEPVPTPDPPGQQKPVLIMGTGQEETPGQTCTGQVQDSGDSAATRPVPCPPPLRGGQGTGQPGQADPPQPPCTRCGKPVPTDWAARGYDTHVMCDPADLPA